MNNNNFLYLEKLIEKLSKDEGYILPVFLLKCQYAEYGLKYLLSNYPYKPRGFLPENFLEKATMGMVIGKLEELKDVHLNDIIANAKKFNKLRNEMMHYFLASDKDILAIETELKESKELIDEIEGGIHFLFDFINDISC